MSRITWMAGTLEDGNNAVKLEQVLHLAEEMFDSLAVRLQKKVEDKRAES